MIGTAPARFQCFPHRWGFGHQRWLGIAGAGLFLGYGIYELMLGKFFSPSVTPEWYRDLGILWDLADDTIRNRTYQIGQYFFPPPNAIAMHLYGLMDRDLAFRLFLLIQVAAVAAAIVAWLVLIGVARHPARLLIVVTGFVAAQTYVDFELAMHNTNAVTFALVAVALAAQRRVGFSTGCYAFSLVLKPYASVLILPWRAWQRNWGWTAWACGWLVALFGVLPAVWFGVEASVALYREWIVSMLTAARSDAVDQLSIGAGIAALMDRSVADPVVRSASLGLQGVWLIAVLWFFVPLLKRRGPRDALSFATDAAAILLAALPLGNHQQPARGIVLLASTLVIAAAAFDWRRDAGQRFVLAGILGIVTVSTHAVPMGPWHFLLTLPVCLLSLSGLALARKLPADPAPDQMTREPGRPSPQFPVETLSAPARSPA